MENFGTNITDVKVYSKVSNIEPPFWGITENRIKQLKSSGVNFYVRFDYPKGSITLTSEQVDELLKGKKVAGDGDYKIVLEDLKKIFCKII
jgi:hypothetical protein